MLSRLFREVGWMLPTTAATVLLLEAVDAAWESDMLVAQLLVVALAVAGVVVGIAWLAHRHAQPGPPRLHAAPDDDLVVLNLSRPQDRVLARVLADGLDQHDPHSAADLRNRIGVAEDGPLL